ncbi:hypothetical protein BO82DRAFT_353545 [Aspergillus uvarum CBS 121591]|uniref:Uncharacterized protein n=1 Tax=Aspergillus uvarum CBS 121591 TaxID=1448315 RepID=A0A319CUS8_9EURO|nr:hypothetical protein BO82DRAFT_353545 [Aspergillus uvarum CBS 121591]PYH82583.1 hypothetical protein BO82DRAFT_353545 [Aspergillus uvarum CBS 121591]
MKLQLFGSNKNLRDIENLSPVVTTQPPIPIVKWGPGRAIVQGNPPPRRVGNCTIHLASLSTLTRSGVEFRQR